MVEGFALSINKEELQDAVIQNVDELIHEFFVSSLVNFLIPIVWICVRQI